MIIESTKKCLNFLSKNPGIMVLGLANWVFTTAITLILGGSILTPSINPMTAGDLSSYSQFDPNMMGGFIISVLAITVINFLIQTYFIAAIYRFIKVKDIKQSLREALSVYFNLILGTIVKSVVSFVILIIPGIISMVLAMISPVLMILSLLIMVIAVIYANVKLYFINLLICLKGKGPVEAVSESFKYSEGYFYQVASTMIGASIIVGIPVGIISLVFSMSGAVGSMISSALISAVSTFFYVLPVVIYMNIRKTAGAKTSV